MSERRLASDWLFFWLDRRVRSARSSGTLSALLDVGQDVARIEERMEGQEAAWNAGILRASWSPIGSRTVCCRKPGPSLVGIPPWPITGNPPGCRAMGKLTLGWRALNAGPHHALMLAVGDWTDGRIRRPAGFPGLGAKDGDWVIIRDHSS